MDNNSRKAIIIVAALFVMVGGLIILSRTTFNLGEGELYQWFTNVANSDWAIVIVIATYILASFIGVPQWVLFSATFIVFGLRDGVLLSWLSTLVSATFNFFLGRWVGAERVNKYGGKWLGRFVTMIRRNGFLSSFAVRLIPTGPFVLVNMAAGVSKMRYIMFMAGTALGIIPKILIVGLLTRGVLSGAQGQQIMWVFIAAAFCLLIITILVRRRLGKFMKE